jgi:hypothetical protein
MSSAGRVAVISIALSIQAGCFPERWSPGVHKAAYVVDGGLVLIGAVALVSAHCSNDPDPALCQGVANAIGFLSIGSGGIGALLNAWMGAGSEPSPAEASPAGPAPGPSSPIPGLDQFAVEAAAAARLGHCDVARASLRPIFREDRAFFDEIVAADPALRGCLR